MKALSAQKGVRRNRANTAVSGLSFSERLAARDPAAIIELYTSLSPALLGMANHLAVDARDAAWAVEEAFVRLWFEAGKPPDRGLNPVVWLVLETRRLALLGRGNQKTKTGLAPVAGPGPLALNDSMPTSVEIRQLEARHELLKKAFHQLPRQQQEALKLLVWQGMETPAIAAKLGEPLARVEATLKAGMRFIRHRISVVMGKWSAPI